MDRRGRGALSPVSPPGTASKAPHSKRAGQPEGRRSKRFETGVCVCAATIIVLVLLSISNRIANPQEVGHVHAEPGVKISDEQEKPAVVTGGNLRARGADKAAPPRVRVIVIEEEADDDDDEESSTEEAEAPPAPVKSKPQKKPQRPPPAQQPAEPPPAAPAPPAAEEKEAEPEAPAAAAPAAQPAADAGAGAMGDPHNVLAFYQRFMQDKPLEKEECESFYGNSWLRSFIDSRKEVCTPDGGGSVSAADSVAGSPRVASRITGWEATTGGRFFWMRNVALDFTKASTQGDHRQFDHGFLQTSCNDHGTQFRGWDKEEASLTMGTWANNAAQPLTCDEWVHTPTLIVQHDDIGNNYHNLADLWRVWMALAILQQPQCATGDGRRAVQDPTLPVAPTADAQYVPPIDAMPACGPGEEVIMGLDPAAVQLMNLDGRIMCNTVMPDGSPVSGPREDCFGPYFPQYEHWFGKGVIRGRDFAGKRICFSALGWVASIPENHVWKYFGETAPCDVPSPLFQQYVSYMMARWGLTAVVPPAFTDADCNEAAVAAVKAADGTRVPASCTPLVRVLYVVRKKKPFNPSPIVDRVVANDPEFISAIQAGVAAAGGQVDVDVADFTGMAFEEQLRRIRAAHVVIGMHGAGMVHGIHMALTDVCGGPGAVIELLPHGHGERGIQHLVSYAGLRYYRWDNSDPSRETPGRGTMVDTNAISNLVQEAATYVLGGRQPACKPK